MNQCAYRHYGRNYHPKLCCSHYRWVCLPTEVESDAAFIRSEIKSTGDKLDAERIAVVKPTVSYSLEHINYVGAAEDKPRLTTARTARMYPE